MKPFPIRTRLLLRLEARGYVHRPQRRHVRGIELTDASRDAA